VIGPEEREIGTPQELEKLNKSFPLEQKTIKKQEFADATAVGKKEERRKYSLMNAEHAGTMSSSA
jgi:hypothetical protein